MSGTRIGRSRERVARRMRDRTGGTLVLVAGAMLGLLAMAALAVDMSAAFAWRAEAQKIADASSLAGASSYMDFIATEAEPAARARAYEYALNHTIKGEPVDSSEVTVQVIPSELKVRVAINRPDMPVWFARILGFAGVDIGAVAAAAAEPAGAAQCLKPWAVPDMWDESNEPGDPPDNIWQDGEEWEYDPDEDTYIPVDSIGADGLVYPSNATGYGSEFREDPPGDGRDNDWGRPIQLKHSQPQDEHSFAPGIFFPWRIPLDEDQEECDRGGGGGNDAGAALYRRNICSCNDSPIELNTPYDVEPGNMIGPTNQGVRELFEEDPNAEWRDIGHPSGTPNGPGIYDSETGEFRDLDSPRVVKVGLMDPGEIDRSGMQTIEFNNFAMLFLEEQASGQDPVMARFMFFASGQESGNGITTGSLVKLIRLVE